MGKQNVNVQDVFLNELRKNKLKFSLFLTGGFVYTNATILAYDNYSVLIQYPHKEDSKRIQQAMIYKHAISTFQPSYPVDISPKESKAPVAADF